MISPPAPANTASVGTRALFQPWVNSSERYWATPGERRSSGDPKEEEIHSFLADHPDVLMRWAGVLGSKSAVRSKVSLHSHVTDFAIGNWRETTSRWEWLLVEIERPQYQLFTKQGDPTRELSHAMRQIAD
jgi:hypothetical protein